MLYLDTHAVLWLHEDKLKRFSKKAIQAMEENDLCISPMVMLELEYLREVGKTTKSPNNILKNLTREINLQICDEPFNHIIEQARPLKWTRDPFDRIITAQARAQSIPLLTKDEMILKNYKKAFWD